MYCEFLSFSGLLNMIFLVGTSSKWNMLLAHTYNWTVSLIDQILFCQSLIDLHQLMPNKVQLQIWGHFPGKKVHTAL